jgi:hypothetical protein
MIGNSQEEYVLKEEAVFHTNKHIRILFKQFLHLLEDMKFEHDVNYSKLKESLPEAKHLIDMANFLDEKKYSHSRKKILDFGNDAIRNLDNDFKAL